MSFLIPFNASKLVPNGFNNTWRHEFVGSAVNLQNCEIAIHNISMYNSVFNIDGATYGNNSLQIKVPTTSGEANVDITIPDGTYSYSDLTTYIQSRLVAAGAYLINADGMFVHYFQLSENPVYYAAQIDLLPIPTSLPAGWSRPATGVYSSGGTGLPSAIRVMRVIINNAKFGDIIGFLPGDYPANASTTAQTFLSNESPTVHPVSAYLVRCNLITNKFVMPQDVLGTFDSNNTQSGQLISYRPNEHNFCPISDGSYSNITLTITDQSGNFVRIRDPGTQITLAIREAKK